MFLKVNYIKEDEIDGSCYMDGKDKTGMQFFIQETWKAWNISRYKRKCKDKYELDMQEMEC